MKKTVCILFSVILLLATVFAMPANAEPNTLHIVTAYDSSTTNDRLLYHLYKRIGYNVYLDSLSMKMATETANSGEADGIGNSSDEILASYSHLRAVPEVFSVTTFEAYATLGSGLQMTQWADLKGYRVGMISQKLHILNHLPEGTEAIHQYDSFADLNQALLAGEIDILITSKGISQTLNIPKGVEYIGTLDTLNTVTAVHEDHEDLIPELTKALREMKADGTYDAIVNGTYRTDNTKKVLHISSYGPEDIWDIELQAAILTVLDQADDILYFNASLNSNHYHSDMEIAKNALSDIRTLTMDRLPDLVIISDNPALRFVMEYGNYLFGETPIIYCGITESDDFFQSIQGQL